MWVSNCNLLKLLALLWGRSVFSAGQRQSLQTILTPLPLIHMGLFQHLGPTKFNPFFHQKLLIYHHFTSFYHVVV